MQLKEAFEKTILFFKDKGFETPRLDAELLFFEALGLKDRVELYLKYDKPLSDAELNKCRDFVKRRANQEPVAYIVGHKHFLNWEFQVNPHVLIPRPETEVLAEWMVDQILKQNFYSNPFPNQQAQQQTIDLSTAVQFNKLSHEVNGSSKTTTTMISILDMGSGSGCLGIGIHKLLEQKQMQKPTRKSSTEQTDQAENKVDSTPMIKSCVYGIDISAEAVAVARQNAANLQVDDSCFYFQSDLNQMKSNDVSQLLAEKNPAAGFHVIVANPPYIDVEDPETQKSVKQYEPHLALFSANKGLHHIEKWLGLAADLIKTNLSATRPSSPSLSDALSTNCSDNSMKTSVALVGFEIGYTQGEVVKKMFLDSNVFSEVKILKDYSQKDRFVVGIKNG
jgi:release factor glutamine methyltransferase